MFHLGWFLGPGFGIQPWRATFSGRNGEDWMKPDIYRDLTSSLERGGFDFVFIEDTAMVEDTFEGSSAHCLNMGHFAPKNDPMPLLPLMVQGSQSIGVIATISTAQYHPYLAARQLTTIDHLTNGRAGANIVTSVTHRVAQNFGRDQHPPHDVRYEMAEEWMDVVTGLWNSWEDGAVVNDPDIPMYVDHTKVHPIEYRGKHFASRGPLNTIPSPQRRPVIAQAGNSVPGRELAARHADTMLAMGRNPAQMKAFREDMHERLVRHGRKPEDLKVMFLVTPMLGETDAHAQEREKARAAFQQSDENVRDVLFDLSYISGGEVDFGAFDLDALVPEVIGNGEQSSMKHYLTGNEHLTLRELASGIRQIDDLGLIGSPDTVAAKMGELMDEVGGDGFLVYPEMTRRTIAEYADGLCPALRKRGLIRDGYAHQNFRDNLLDF